MTATSPGGRYTITVARGTLAASNYAFTTFNNGTLTVDQVPNITSAAGATFTVGKAGSFTVTTTGYPAAALKETGTLPRGVTFVDNGDGTATLSGTPTATTGDYVFDITADNPDFPPIAQTFTLAVTDPPIITSATGDTFTVGKAGKFTITTTPGLPATTTLSESGKLPSGVTFKAGSNGTATLSGTPAAGSGGVYTFTISAGNAASSVTTQAFTLTVDQAPAITSAASATFDVGSCRQLHGQDHGLPGGDDSPRAARCPVGVTWWTTSNGTATLSGTPAAAGGYSFTITAANGLSPAATQHFTLTVDQAPAITSPTSATFIVGQKGSFTITAAKGTPAATTKFSESGKLPGGVTLQGQRQRHGHPERHAGRGQRRRVPDHDHCRATLPAARRPALYALRGPGARHYQRRQRHVRCRSARQLHGEDHRLPGGDVHLGSRFAQLVYVVGAQQRHHHDERHARRGRQLQLHHPSGQRLVAGRDPALHADGGPGARHHDPDQHPVHRRHRRGASRSPPPRELRQTPKFSESGKLPGGVRFKDNGNGTATLSGTPAAGSGGAYPITITASNAPGSTATQPYTLYVDQAPAITSAAVATFDVGQPGSFTVKTTGYPATALSESGTLPAGVTFLDNGNGTATLSGTPFALSGTPPAAVAGTYHFTIKAGKSASAPSQNFTLTVDQAPIISSVNSDTFTIGQAGSFTVATAGFPAATLSESGKLPSGVTFKAGRNGTATLSGTPSATDTVGTYTFTITASNGVSPEAFQLFTLTVAAAKSSPPTGTDLLDAAAHDAATMAVLADSDGDTTSGTAAVTVTNQSPAVGAVSPQLGFRPNRPSSGQGRHYSPAWPTGRASSWAAPLWHTLRTPTASCGG